jgi:RNA polymerase sigma factor (TIGR02999 family)
MADASGSPPTHAVTDLLGRLSGGDRAAFDELLPLVYSELKAVASRQMGGEASGHTLSPTALVHEVYFRLAGQREPHYQDRAHFLGVAARAMRRVLVDHARGRRRHKRDAGQRVELTPDVAVSPDPEQVLALDDALERLAAIDARQARVVELRYFMGLDLDETAQVVGVSTATVKRDWVLARGFLREVLTAG